MLRGSILLTTIVLAGAVPAAAQPAAAIEGIAGQAAFVDDVPIGHLVLGGAARVHLAPRHSIGPELVFMRGPRSDRDWFFTVNYTFDFVRQGQDDVRRRVNPFLVAGGGMMRHSNRFGAEAFSSSEGAFTAGGGVRVWLTDRVYALGEVRGGWEAHVRWNGGVGVRFR